MDLFFDLENYEDGGDNELIELSDDNSNFEEDTNLIEGIEDDTVENEETENLIFEEFFPRELSLDVKKKEKENLL